MREGGGGNRNVMERADNSDDKEDGEVEEDEEHRNNEDGNYDPIEIIKGNDQIKEATVTTKVSGNSLEPKCILCGLDLHTFRTANSTQRAGGVSFFGVPILGFCNLHGDSRMT